MTQSVPYSHSIRSFVDLPILGKRTDRVPLVPANRDLLFFLDHEPSTDQKPIYASAKNAASACAFR